MVEVLPTITGPTATVTDEDTSVTLAGASAITVADVASTALNVLFRHGLESSGFRGALVFYPGCGDKSLLGPTLKSRVPIQLFLAADDISNLEDSLPDIGI